jgi:hypothetical protein
MEDQDLFAKRMGTFLDRERFFTLWVMLWLA